MSPEPQQSFVSRILDGPRTLLNDGVAAGESIPRRERLLLTAYFTIKSLKIKDIGTRASSTTYTFVFALVPLLTTTIAFLTALPGLQGQRADLEQALFSFFVSEAALSVQSYIDEIAEKASAAGAVSSLIFLVTTLLLLRNVERSFNYIWQVDENRTWGQRLQVMAMTFVLAAIAILGLVSVSGLAEGYLGGSSFKETAPKVLVRGLSLAMAWLVFTLANVFLPNTRVRLKPALVGSIIAGTAWHYLKYGFTWYVLRFTSYENIYGALGTIPVFLLWLYLSFYLLFISAEITYVYQYIRGLIEKEHLHRTQVRPHAYFSVGIAVALAQAYTHFKISPKMTIRDLAKSLSAMPLLVEESLIPLVRAKLVLEIEEAGRTLYILALPAEQLTVGDVARTVVGDNLDVPAEKSPSPLNKAIDGIFSQAREVRNSALDSMTISELRQTCFGDILPDKTPEPLTTTL